LTDTADWRLLGWMSFRRGIPTRLARAACGRRTQLPAPDVRMTPALGHCDSRNRPLRSVPHAVGHYSSRRGGLGASHYMGA
jgi:hypothetical protein